MKGYDKNKESSYIKYQGINNLYGQEVSQKLPLGALKWVKETSQFNEDFIKSYNDAGYFLEVDVQYPEELHELHNDFSFLPKGMKIGQTEKRLANLYNNKKIYFIHIRNLKQALNQGLMFKKCIELITIH